MSDRRAVSYLLVVFLMIALIWAVSDSRLTSQGAPPEETLVPGRNVNMVSGTTLPGGDPWLQRQNEPSMAVSTRNPLHLLAGANDYRTVDLALSEGALPGKAQGAMAGDAWVGIYKSFDGGESWVTGLIPGFPQDLSPEGSASPLKQFSTAADPIVRAGTNGLFYYSGMAFNRAQTKGGGSIFLARFIDNNDAEDIAGDPIKYLDTRIIDLGTSGQFIDMPRIAADIPRGSGTVTLDGQTVPAGNVYCAYTVFLGNADINVRSRILFRRSTDCGATWGQPIKVSESQHIIQGAAFAIDPRNGAIYLAFRRFQHPSQTDSIVIVRSTDLGQTFSAPAVIAGILPFDQPATDMLGDNLSDPEGSSFRTNSYPTVAVDDTGIVYVAWTERGHGPTGEARIVMSTAQDGAGWTAPAPVVDIGLDDPEYAGYQGHQFMPSLAFSQGKLALVWYDQRRDEYGALHGVWNWISDNMPVRHTTDVRCAQADPGRFPVFRASSQVSKYIWTLKPGTDDQIEQQQFNPPNYEMFKGGTTPFHGDYIEIAAAPPFVLGASGWTYNTARSKSPLFHAVWTDNRDVRPPADGNWANYTPPASAQGVFGSKTCGSVNTQAMGMRNQNIYTSALVGGIAAASPGNSKELGDLGDYFEAENGLIPRAFAVYVKNPDGNVRVFRLAIDPEPADVDASFVEYEDLENLEVMIAPFSTIARTVFVRAPQAHAAVSLSITEIDMLGGVPVPDGLTAAVVLNPDPTSPPFSPPDEYHNPNIRNMEIVSWGELNANIVNPNIRNPNIRNWDEMNPSIINPNIRNPNIRNTDIVNPNIRNADAANPNIRNVDVVNPNIRNPNIRNYTLAEFDGAQVSDAVFNIRNDGNTTSTYTLKTYSKEALPDEVYAQLLVYRVHYTPAADYYQQTDLPCELAEERHHQLLLNVTNPNIRNPNVANPNIRNPNIRNGGLDNATFAVAPGEEIEAILRVIDFEPGAQSQFRIMQTGAAFSAQAFAESIGFAATAHAVNTDEARTIEEKKVSPKTTATKLIISTSSLPYGIVGAPYDAALTADGGAPGYSWALNAGELPPGLSLSSSGFISGTPTTAGFYRFIVRVDDSAGDFDTQKFSIYVDADGTADGLAVLTASLPSGVLQHWYGATLEASGGVWPLTWSLASGTLPFGLSLDESGVISGTIQVEEGQDYPTTYSFAVVVTDGAGTSSAPQPLSIYVNLWTGVFLTISGTVYSTGGTPLDGAVMRGLPNTPVTGANGVPGYYEDTVPDQWSGTVTPFYAGQTFSPASRTYTMIGSAQTGQDYNTALTPVAISGTVLFGEVGLEGVLMTGLPGSPTPTTDTAGNYSVTVPYGWSGTVTPTLLGYAFTPESQAYSAISTSAVTNYEAAEAYRVVFHTNRDGNDEVYVMSADGTSQTNLTNNPATDMVGDIGSCWSPDGSKIVFASDRYSAPDFEYFIMNADGSAQTRLSLGFIPIGLQWSPDGTKILLENYSSPRNIWSVNPDGTGLVNLSHSAFQDTWSTWSPDGSMIAFTRGGRLYVMNADGSGQREVTLNVTTARAPNWSPDGAALAFDSASEIYAINVDGTGMRRLTNNTAFEQQPIWSPDGGKILFDSRRDDNIEIYVMNADGTGQTNLSNNAALDYLYEWSPDGARILFASSRDGNVEIYVMDADGSNVRRLTNNNSAERAPHWSPGSGMFATYEFAFKWGVNGPEDGNFNTPVGLATASGPNEIVVADCYNSRIQRFTSEGTFLSKWGNRTYHDVALDSLGNSYATYYDGHCVHKFDPLGGLLGWWGKDSSGSIGWHTVGFSGVSGDEDGALAYPVGVAVDSSGDVYVTDGNQRVQKFTSTGAFLGKWGSAGTGDGQFTGPWGIAIDAQDNVYVTELAGSRIQKFTSEGTFLSKWGRYGPGDGEFGRAVFIAVDRANCVYVTDRDNNRVQKFSSTGKFLTKFGSYGTGPGQFRYPEGVAVDSSGNVYVADSNNHCIHKFRKK